MGIMDWFRRRAEAPAAAESDLLARITAAIETTRTPFIRIDVADRDEALAPTASKIGGVPYLPDDAAPTGHRVAGYCAFTHDDPRTPDDPKLSLLQLDSDEHVFWGDTGIAHWFIREADLRARDFSRVEYYWDCC